MTDCLTILLTVKHYVSPVVAVLLDLFVKFFCVLCSKKVKRIRGSSSAYFFYYFFFPTRFFVCLKKKKRNKQKKNITRDFLILLILVTRCTTDCSMSDSKHIHIYIYIYVYTYIYVLLFIYSQLRYQKYSSLSYSQVSRFQLRFFWESSKIKFLNYTSLLNVSNCSRYDIKMSMGYGFSKES